MTEAIAEVTKRKPDRLKLNRNNIYISMIFIDIGRSRDRDFFLIFKFIFLVSNQLAIYIKPRSILFLGEFYLIFSPLVIFSR